MYCRNCGKPVEDNQEYCLECQNVMSQNNTTKTEYNEVVMVERTSNYEYAPYDYAPTGNPVMRGFGPALTSVILSYVAALFIGIVYVLSSAAAAEPDRDLIITVIVCGVFLGGIGLVLSIISLVLGINSIKTFKSTPVGVKKPIPTLILGIYGLVSSAEVLIIAAYNALIVLSFLTLYL